MQQRDFYESSHAEILSVTMYTQKTRGKQCGDSEVCVISVSGRCEKSSPTRFCLQVGLVTPPFLKAGFFVFCFVLQMLCPAAERNAGDQDKGLNSNGGPCDRQNKINRCRDVGTARVNTGVVVALVLLLRLLSSCMVEKPGE